MIDICEFLDVSDVKKPSGQVIENCEDYNGALKILFLCWSQTEFPYLKPGLKIMYVRCRIIALRCLRMSQNQLLSI